MHACVWTQRRHRRRSLDTLPLPSTPFPLPVSAEGKPIPSELRKEEAELRHQVELEDDNTAVPRTHIDDEYAHAGERDPKLLITTSRDPSTRLVQFAKEVKLLFPNSHRVNRGGMVSSLLLCLLFPTAWVRLLPRAARHGSAAASCLARCPSWAWWWRRSCCCLAACWTPAEAPEGRNKRSKVCGSSKNSASRQGYA
jgi:hypothetical protein